LITIDFDGFYSLMCYYRAKKVQEARVYAEQELNKYRVEYEERYTAEAARVGFPCR